MKTTVLVIVHKDQLRTDRGGSEQAKTMQSLDAQTILMEGVEGGEEEAPLSPSPPMTDFSDSETLSPIATAPVDSTEHYTVETWHRSETGCRVRGARDHHTCQAIDSKDI